MSEEAMKLASKIRQLDKRIVKFRENDERIMREGGARAESYIPMAPRAERDREKALTRLRQLEEREGRVYYYEPEEELPEELDPSPGIDEPDDELMNEDGTVKLQDRSEQIDEWTSPPTPAPPTRQSGRREPKETLATDQRPSASIPASQRVSGTTVGSYQRTAPVARYLPEPTWDGMGVHFAVIAAMFLGVIAALYMMIFGGAATVW